MKIPVTDARRRLNELVRRAEAGDEVILTRHGLPTVRLLAIKKELRGVKARREFLQAISAEGAA